MSLRTLLISIWTKKDDKVSFVENELEVMGPGEKHGK